MIVSEKSIEEILLEIVPKVGWLTEWDCSLKDLTIKIVKPGQVFEQAFLPKYKALNVDITPKTLQERFSFWAVKYFFPHIILGVYEPATDSIIVIPDNLSSSTNESGLATVLGHEMTHRFQFFNNPKFMRTYNNLIKRTASLHNKEQDNSEDMLQYCMTLIEGDASFVENQLRKMHYQNAAITPGPFSLSLGLMGGLCFKDFRKKAAQYIKGQIMVKREYKARGRKGVNALYNLNLKKIRKKIYIQKKSK